jgi:FkbM family methyltransferase
VKQALGIWLPDADTHFERMMRKAPTEIYKGNKVGVYQRDKLLKALSYCQDRRIAIDIGAHVGFWSMWLALEFDAVYAIEPRPEHAECFRRNVTAENVALFQGAVGAEGGLVGLAVEPENSGKTHVSGHGDCTMRRLDDWRLSDVSFIKIDTEGFESNVIEGGRQTIIENRPIIVVESNGQHERYGLPEPVGMLQEMGMRVLEQASFDYIMGW